MIKLAVGKGQMLGLSLHDRDMSCEEIVAINPGARGLKHLRALVKSDYLAVVTSHELSGYQTRPCRYVEHTLLCACLHSVDHRRAPARILAKAQCRTDTVIVRRKR